MDRSVVICFTMAIALVIVIGIDMVSKEHEDGEWMKTKAKVRSVTQTRSRPHRTERANIYFRRKGNIIYSRIDALRAGTHGLREGHEIHIRYRINRYFGLEFYRCCLEENSDEFIRSDRNVSFTMGTLMILFGIVGYVVMIIHVFLCPPA